MWSVPVTFGGGIMMQYGAPLPVGSKYPADSHSRYSSCSIWWGSKLLCIVSLVRHPKRKRVDLDFNRGGQRLAQIFELAPHDLGEPAAHHFVQSRLQRRHELVGVLCRP